LDPRPQDGKTRGPQLSIIALVIGCEAPDLKPNNHPVDMARNKNPTSVKEMGIF
jgi:hypothetical protein